VRAEGECIDASPSLPFREASPEVGFNTRCRLIAFFGGLGEELQDDLMDRCREVL